MLKLSVNMRQRRAGYEIRATVSFSRSGETTNDLELQKRLQEEYTNKLESMQQKLEHIVPSQYRPKYNFSRDDLSIVVKAEKALEAQQAVYKLEEYIRSAAMALKLK